MKGISAQARAKIREAVRAAGKPPPRTHYRPAGADVQPVECGASIDTAPLPHYDGMLQAVPGLDSADWDDAGTESVVLADLNGNELTEGLVYNAVRYGQTDAGIPVYWADTAGGNPAGEQPDSGTISADSTWTDMGEDLTLPGAGTYLLFAKVTASMTLSNAGSAAPAFIVARLFDETAGVPVPRSQVIVVGAQIIQTAGVKSDNLFPAGTGTIVVLYAVDGASVIRIEAARAVGPTYTASAVENGTTFGSGATSCGYVKLS